MEKLFSLICGVIFLVSCSNPFASSSQPEVVSSSSQPAPSSVSIPEQSSVAEQGILFDIVFETYELENDAADPKLKYYMDFPLQIIHMHTNL